MGTPSASAPVVRVIQLTDLHLQRISDHSRRIAATVNRLRPDILVLTGDMIDRADRVPELRAFLALLDPAPLKVATLGNWEHWGRINLDELNAAYRDASCRLLVNESNIVERAGCEIAITGMDDETGGRPDLEHALAGVRPLNAHLLLAHSPVYRDVLAAGALERSGHSVTAVLSGHTHGGQVALLGWAPIRPPGSGRYVRGWYRDASPALYVSRGLGTSVAPVRFGSPPEIAVFDWSLPDV
jgi:predicted MPP superfamily phosphohydrolase